jgi:hypothetical protein
MTNAHNFDEQFILEHFVHDTIIAHPNTITELGADQFFDTMWIWVMG